jgi:hypothetical protein
VSQEDKKKKKKKMSPLRRLLVGVVGRESIRGLATAGLEPLAYCGPKFKKKKKKKKKKKEKAPLRLLSGRRTKLTCAGRE